jgi:antitoxin ParD1/3/4
MVTASLNLGEHWEVFIRNEIDSSRYGSASEVMREALRTLEEREAKLDAPRTHLAQGAEQANRSEFVGDYSPAKLVAEADAGSVHAASLSSSSRIASSP